MFEKIQNGCLFLGILFHVVHNGISARVQETDRFRNKAHLVVFESVNDRLDALNLVSGEIEAFYIWKLILAISQTILESPSDCH